MTAQRDLKRIIRDRQLKTGEAYTAARSHVVREQKARLGIEAQPESDDPMPFRFEAVVLKVNARSIRVRLFGEDPYVTFRSSGLWRVVPGQVVTLVIDKRWSWNGGVYASGRMENLRIDIAQLGLVPLPLYGGEFEDLRARSEPYRDPDPYAPMWRQLTATPRADFQMDPIAWGVFPGADGDDIPTCDAADLAEQGDLEGAIDLLTEALCTDLRCLDAHAHLGNFDFDRRPERALLHYEIGVRIGELSLPPGFDGVLLWGHIYNRPFLRCLHGYGLCLWRLGNPAEAQKVFERILFLSPMDNQGVRFCWENVRNGKGWKEQP